VIKSLHFGSLWMCANESLTSWMCPSSEWVLRGIGSDLGF